MLAAGGQISDAPTSRLSDLSFQHYPADVTAVLQRAMTKFSCTSRESMPE